jgi:hypothetical protein
VVLKVRDGRDGMADASIDRASSRHSENSSNIS